ncbi:MAG TPA: ABC transporter permease [Coriobacteriia bacterium]|nr:ABC transporter permease [Coriobacteriia bacterium]
MSRRRTGRVLARPTIALAVYLGLASVPRAWVWAFGHLFPNETRLIYERSGMLELIGEHLQMVGLAAFVSIAAGMALGVFVTRPAGRDFYDVISDLANFGQTFPPIAVLTLAIPLLGLGFRPTVFALALYGVLPVLQNTIAGLESVPPAMVESARAMGMRPLQVLWRLELPVAAPVIFAGVRVSVVVAVATATIGATINAGGLGGPIISGLANFDPAVTLQGGLLAAGLALILDAYLSAFERLAGRTVSSRAA